MDCWATPTYVVAIYGVPVDLSIQRFVGQELNQICLGRVQIQLHFSGTRYARLPRMAL